MHQDWKDRQVRQLLEKKISLDDDLLKQLEKYPHIHKMIKLSWGTVPLDRFISGLLMDSRDGERQGFPPEVASALVRLQANNEKYLNNVGIVLDVENKI